MDKIPGRVISFLSAILIAVSSASCVEELVVDRNFDVKEGLPVQMTLDFLSQQNRVETRAAQDKTYENRVNNLYVFIFNQAGEVHYKKFFGTTDISYGSTSYSNGSISIETTSLNSARVVCIANLSTTEVSSGYEVSSDVMDGITSLEELEDYVMELTENTIERSSQFMMTGYAYDGAGSNLINIPGTEDGSSSFECTLRPERTDAKVEFVVKTEIPEDKVGSWTNFDFRPSGWRVVNVPAQSVLLPRETGDADGSYFTTDEMPFETIERDENYLYTSGGFVFYMPENRKTPKLNISGDGLTSDEMYAMREERDHQSTDGSFPDRPGQKFENGSFTYAPENATYVEMSGTLSYMDKNYAVNAEVTFTVHLGYSGGDCNDYDTRRNTHYIYNVTLRGINDIKLEVTEDEETERRPGYEGDVIYSRQGNLYELDAHYDRELITIDMSDVPDMTWGVQTPWDKSIYTGDFSDSATPEASGIYDYKWIKFAINSDYGQGEDKYVKYPGDQNYKGGRNEQSGYDGHTSHPDARLLDVHQLLQRLKQEYNGGTTTGNVAVTAFIDEYVYVREPSSVDENDNSLLSQWRRYVEAEDRLLYFINGTNSRYSPDGASSVIEAIHTFKQKSIRSVFNVKNKSESELPTAWGLESRMEGNRLSPGDVTRGTSTSNGRLNTIRCLLGENYNSNRTLNWTDVLNTSDRYALNSGSDDAVHAVLMRNRDLNGDDIVQPNEIRWYLAAIDQLVDLYIGEYALDEASRLYPANPADRDNQTYWHYTSSSADGENPWVLWAEECVALGNYGTSFNKVGGMYTYRCIRNLGIGLENPESEPTPLIPDVTAAENDGTYVIDCTNLSEKSRRLSYEAGSQSVHDDQSPYNRPYGKFRVASVDSDYPGPETNVNWQGAWKWVNELEWRYYQNLAIPGGYRVPNLREMIIMGTRLPEEAWKAYSDSYQGIFGDRHEQEHKAMYMTYTSFSRGTYGNGDRTFSNKTGGFRFNAEDGSIGATESGHGGYVRGVKDEQY